MARWLVAGAAGMLGRDLCRVVEDHGHEVTGADLPEIDILDPAQCAASVEGHDVVVNSAAYTAVGATMVQLSTDYVVAGDGSQPYAADSAVAPASAYGRTKAAGEWAVRAECARSWVVRTAWLYGAGGTNFPATMRRLAGNREVLTVVADQVGQPTWTVDLAEGIVRIVDSRAPFGIWHATGGGQCTWYELARAVFEELGLDPARITPVTTADFRRPAPRPAYSVLSHDMWTAAGLSPLPHWRDALRRAAPTVLTG